MGPARKPDSGFPGLDGRQLVDFAFAYQDPAVTLIDDALDLQVLPADEEDGLYLNFLSTELVLY